MTAHEVLRTVCQIETASIPQESAAKRRWATRLDIAAILLVMVGAFALGAGQYLSRIADAAFYQSSFVQALHLACGGGFQSFVPNAAARAFLANGPGTFSDCASVRAAAVALPDMLEASFAYLQLLAVASWAIFGLTWKSLFLVAGLLTAGLAVACYVLMRLLCPSRLVALALTVVFILFTPLVYQIPNLRDFSKAPFLIGGLAALTAIISRKCTARQIVIYGATAGALIGIGQGFRADVELLIPAVLIIPLLLIGTGNWRQWATKGAVAWAACGAAYLAARLPLLALVHTPPHLASFGPHVFYLGFADEFLSGTLGMRSAGYEIIPLYIDQMVWGLANLFGGQATTLVSFFYSAAYDQVTKGMLIDAIMTTPNDVLLRLFYGINQVGHMGINRLTYGLPLLIVLPILFVYGPRIILFILFNLIVFVSALTFQFAIRHGFYDEIFGCALLAFLVGVTFEISKAIIRHKHPLPLRWKTSLGLLLCGAAGLTVTTAIASDITYRRQRYQLADTAEALQALKWIAVATSANSTHVFPIGLTQPARGLEFDVAHRNIAENLADSTTGLFARIQFTPAQEVALTPFAGWRASQGEPLKIVGAGFSSDPVKDGYAVESAPITVPVDGVNPTAVGLSLDVDIRGSVLFGILNSDRSAWLMTSVLPEGRSHIERGFVLPKGQQTATLVFSRLSGPATLISVTDAGYHLTSKGECDRSSLALDYSYTGRQLNFPVSLPRHGRATLLFPMIYSPHFKFAGLVGSPACIASWSIAPNYPAGLLPLTMMLRDGTPVAYARGDWGDVWNGFIN